MLSILKNHKHFLLFILVVGTVLFLFALIAFHNLGKFETTDEDLWIGGRIGQYWKYMERGLHMGDWEGTRVNDKPGVSVSILSGLHLDSIPNPDSQDISRNTSDSRYLMKYRYDKTEEINKKLRQPIVWYTVVAIGTVAFAVFLLSRSYFISLFTLVLVAFNPVLLGMSQIINPDAVLWSSTFLALLFYALSFDRRKWYYVLFAGLFFGWALLSKYTANILSFMFIVMLFGILLDRWVQKEDFAKIWKNALWQYLSVTAVAYVVFVLGMPAALFDWSYFTSGTFLSPGMEPVFIPFVVLLGVIFFDGFCLNGFFARRVGLFFQNKLNWFLRVFSFALLFLLILHVFNAWIGTPIIPLNDIQELVELRSSGDIKHVVDLFLLGQEWSSVGFLKVLLTQSSYMIFTLPTFVCVVLFFGLSALIVFPDKMRYKWLVFTMLFSPWFFLVGGTLVGVLVGVRYGIMLQPLFMFLCALFLWQFVAWMKKYLDARLIIGGLCIIFGLSQTWALQTISPHFLNYQNDFLPKQYSFANSWSYGMYEAAQWLNSQPNARDLLVWSDRRVLCYFFAGTCLRRSGIDLETYPPDYFVLTRRNVVKDNRFSWKKPEVATRPSEYYYSDEALNDPAWELLVGGRPVNYVKIIQNQERVLPANKSTHNEKDEYEEDYDSTNEQSKEE